MPPLPPPPLPSPPPPPTTTTTTTTRPRARSTLATHDRQTMVAKPCERLSDLGDAYKAFDVIGIDEGQFFPDLNEFCERAANEGKVVIVAALDGTFERKPFGNVCDLVPLAEHVEKLTAVCRVTGGDASFSRRLGSETAVELIGGADMYMPVSRRGYYAPAQQLVASSSPKAVTPRHVSPISIMSSLGTVGEGVGSCGRAAGGGSGGQDRIVTPSARKHDSRRPSLTVEPATPPPAARGI